MLGVVVGARATLAKNRCFNEEPNIFGVGGELVNCIHPSGHHQENQDETDENRLLAPVVQSFAHHISAKASRSIQCGSRKMLANGGDCLHQMTLPKASFIRAIHRTSV